MIMSPFSLSVVVPVAISVMLGSTTSAGFVWEGWLGWQAATADQEVKQMLMWDILPTTYSPGDVIAGNAFRSEWGVTFTSPSLLVMSPPPQYIGIMAQSPGVGASVTWDAPINNVYFAAIGYGAVNFWRDDTLVYTHQIHVLEAGVISTESFNRLEFVARAPEMNLKIIALAWAVPAPGAAAWLVCGLATGSRRRRRSS
jgi:hypothetical protein